jgi:hypothetical protein
MLPSRARFLATVYKTVGISTPAWEADALVTQPSQTSSCRPNGRTSLKVRMRSLQPLEAILPPGNADVVLHFMIGLHLVIHYCCLLRFDVHHAITAFPRSLARPKESESNRRALLRQEACG